MLGFTARTETIVHAAPDEVFAVAADVSRHNELAGSGEVLMVRVKTPGPTRVGTRFEAEEDIKEDTMTADDMIDTARRFGTEVLVNGNLAAIDEITAPDFRAHLPGVPAPLDADGWKAFCGAFTQAFSERALDIENILTAGDEMVSRVVYRGRHTGEFQGIPPTGRTVAMSGVAWFWFEQGRIAEHWGLFDAMGLMQQLGVIPAAAHAG